MEVITVRPDETRKVLACCECDYLCDYDGCSEEEGESYPAPVPVVGCDEGEWTTITTESVEIKKLQQEMRVPRKEERVRVLAVKSTDHTQLHRKHTRPEVPDEFIDVRDDRVVRCCLSDQETHQHTYDAHTDD